MRNLRDSKSTTIRTYEPLILMSASSIDGACDEVVNIADADGYVGPESDDEHTQDAPSLLSWIRDSFSFGKRHRRRSTQSLDVVEHQIQTVEPRMLLSAESLAASAYSATTDDVEAALGSEHENRAPLFRYISIWQERFGADGTGQIDGHDPDGNTVEYSIVGGRSAEFFEVDSETGAISFRHNPLFSDPTADSDKTYHVVVRISDGELYHDQEIQFVENPNAISGFPSQLIITPENLKTVGIQPYAVPADRTIYFSGPDAHLLEQTRAPNIRFNNPPDFENPFESSSTDDNEYHLVRITDFLGHRNPIAQQVTVRVVDIQDEGSHAPLFFNFEPHLAVQENQIYVTEEWQAFDPDGDTVEASISGGVDEALFEIDAAGELLSFKAAPDFENPADANADNKYEVTIRLSDGTLAQDYELTVTVTDQNIVRRDHMTIRENSSEPILIPDGDQITLIAGIDGDLFETDSDGNVRLKARPDFENPKDHNGDNQYHVSLRILGADGENYVRNVTVEITNEFREPNTDGAVYSDALLFTDTPDTTLLTRPTFRWHHSEDVKEYEIYVGRRGETEAVFRTRGFTENEFQLPDDVAPGEYTIWARVYHNDGTFSRWGKGHDITIGGRPLASVQGNQVTWDAVPSADRYEIWADHIDEYGNHIAEKVISRTDIIETSFTVAAEHDGQNLVWWVRAIDDRDDSVDRSAWSRAAYDQEPEFLPSPGTPVITQKEPCLTTAPNTACPAIYYFPQMEWTPSDGAEEYEIVIREIGASEPHFRQRGIIGTENTFAVQDAKHTFILPLGVNLNTEEVWMRALGTGIAKSRWVRITEFTFV